MLPKVFYTLQNKLCVAVRITFQLLAAIVTFTGCFLLVVNVCSLSIFRSAMAYVCIYCTAELKTFSGIVDHIATDHSNEEIKFRSTEKGKTKTINFKIIPDLCREQGRIITNDKRPRAKNTCF